MLVKVSTLTNIYSKCYRVL